MAGMVYLVGAGPGDYRLISLKAVDCLKKAEVVVYDRLADDRILGWAPRDAEFIYVGKASSHHTMKQPDINQLLVDKAKEGKTVVRLKGGDPFVFGRGGEEGLLLEKNGLPFEVVPVYQTVMAETSEEERAALREQLENGAIDFVTFTSSSTVVNLVKLLGGIEPLKGVKTACIGPVTAETARKHGIEPAIVASHYTIEGLVEAMRESLA